ncbi:helix-turn-helix transcriptional regulator [Oryzibacter oryziterrae]|uniref:helix-turn-helix transcriptional regulator n=1 Tax=Oryzibacter oryziterrae TaxID=2766474 RepID=UPI001F2E5A16|nr:helix-turn-helix transcriptional regulator [Oryzibacter oryziterrae]
MVMITGKLSGAVALFADSEPSGVAYRDIVAVPDLGLRLSVRQLASGTYRRLVIDQATVILVTSGTKQLGLDDETLVLEAGDVALIAPGACLTVTNLTAPRGGYAAEVLSLEAEVVAAYAEAPTGRELPLALRHAPADGFAEAFLRARAELANDALPLAVRRHMLGEVLLRLGSAATVLQRRSREEALEMRIRRLVATDVARDWSAADMARALAVSEATMRRRLGAIGTTLTEIVTDVRMSFALTLLQSTDRSVTTIAFDVGYASPSRFAARFRARFGAAPLDLRGGRFERIGTDPERLEPAAAE